MRNKLLNLLKWTIIVLGVLTVLLAIFVTAYLYISPQFGGTVTEEQKIAYAQSGHYEDDIFINAQAINMSMDCHSIKSMLRETLEPDPNVVPHENIEVNKLQLKDLADSITQLTWFGHSTFLIEIAGKRILIDPIFSQYAAPHPWLGRKRFNKEMPIRIADLPSIDAVIISHDHYDHLDYESIIALRQKVGHFFVPLGVGNHLRRWKIPEQSITELDWWQESKLDDMDIILAPSRHMSGRALTDQSATLWGSWIIASDERSVYFSGDGGYGEHFAEIGEKYGPFDIALMECGQYNKLWKDVHLSPEQTVLAGQDVKAELIVPVHWGSFSLAPHSWTDPIERFTAEAKKQNVKYATPQMGEAVVLGDDNLPLSEWWKLIR